MKIENIVVGALQVNCFVVYDDLSRSAFVIDPGDEAGRIMEIINERELRVERIICTHGHFDHIGAVLRLKDKTDAPVMLHSADYELYARVVDQGRLWGFHVEQPPEPDILLTGGEEISLGRFRLKFLHTPGHSPGSICLLGDGLIFTGDTVFAGSVGRTDFPGGSLEELKRSFARIMSLPSETRILPGHGPLTMVKDEKEDNFFVHEL